MTVYRKSNVPEEYDANFLDRELRAIEQTFAELDFLKLRELFVELERPREGMIVFADGTEWDPGAGRGIYAYYSGVWNKL